MPPQITCASATSQNGETQKLHSALPKFNQLFDFFNVFDSQLILTLLYDSLNLVINAVISGLLGAWFRINEAESAAKLDCVARTLHQCAVFWVSYFTR